jgi:hypothetical protein
MRAAQRHQCQLFFQNISCPILGLANILVNPEDLQVIVGSGNMFGILACAAVDWAFVVDSPMTSSKAATACYFHKRVLHHDRRERRRYMAGGGRENNTMKNQTLRQSTHGMRLAQRNRIRS